MLPLRRYLPFDKDESPKPGGEEQSTLTLKMLRAMYLAAAQLLPRLGAQ